MTFCRCGLADCPKLTKNKEVTSVASKTERNIIALVPCPKCGAAPGKDCVTVRHGGKLYPSNVAGKQHTSIHPARRLLYRQVKQRES
jgi:hypothetical protein